MPRQRRHLASLEENCSGGGRHEPDGRARKARLAASGLADEADDLPALDGEARAGDRAHAPAAATVVLDHDVAQLERSHEPNGSGGHAKRRPFAASRAGTSTAQDSSA
jgi:hypothetical protein